MTAEEKLSKAVKLADAMYYAAQQLTTDASHLSKAMKDWWNFKNVELKEPEDEKIRQKFIKLVKMSSEVGGFALHKWEADEMLAWLEKQEGCEYIKKDWLEHIKQSWYKEGFIDGKYTPKELTINDATTLNELIDFLENGTSKLQHDLTLYANWLKTQFSPNEKQGEQKPTLRERYKNIAESEWFKKTHEGMSISDEEVSNVNKVEPKFKVGDWISNSACTIQITSIDDKYYWHDNNHVGGDIESIDKQYHLWTIEDTKEGDVLAEDPIFECPSSFVAIYKKQNEENFDSYCFVGFNGKFYEGECGHPTEYIHPATKEQRDTLMKAMADAGYEWDAEKKELKIVDWSKHIKYNPNAPSIIKENPAWSEEDEKKRKRIMHRLSIDGTINNEDLADINEWLKSPRLQSHWKPSDEQMNALWDKISNDNLPNSEKEISQQVALTELYEQLKKLREE